MLRRLLIILFLLPVFLSAQESDTVSLVRSVHVAYENDLLAATFDTTTDYYYTGGTLIELNFRWLQKNPASKILVKLPHGRNESFGMTYGHFAFTPTSIISDSILDGDRPFSGILCIGINRVSCNAQKHWRLTSGLGVGIIGPASFSYETQKFIHAHTNNPEPLGWQYQVKNDLYLNYTLKLEKGLLVKKAVEVIGYGIANTGTVYTNAAAGIKIRAGKMQPYFAAPVYSDGILFWIYASGECKAVGYDATLQGGLLNTTSIYSIDNANIRRGVFIGKAGAVIAYHKWRLEYFNAFFTPEFSGGLTHLWGHFGIQYIF